MILSIDWHTLVAALSRRIHPNVPIVAGEKESGGVLGIGTPSGQLGMPIIALTARA
jgi:hypothetical protein